MAVLKPPKTKSEISRLTLAKVRDAYLEMADTYKKMLNADLVYCHKCNTYYSRNNFYSDKRYESGLFPVCKKCLLEMAEGRYYDKSQPAKETKETIINTFRFMDIPFIYKHYNSCLDNLTADDCGINRKSIFSQMVTIIKSINNYKEMSFKDSEFGENGEGEDLIDPSKIKKQTYRRFGDGYNNKEYWFLQNEYEDWITRYECNTKAQEELFMQLSIQKLEISRAQQRSKPTKDLVETYQRLMERANVTPRQNSADVLSEGQTLGKLIEKWETEKPIPEIDPELQDVDKIGQYIDVFFKGHMAKMLNLKNPLQTLYEKVMKKFTVTKPEYDEDSDSEEIFTKIFGKDEE